MLIGSSLRVSSRSSCVLRQGMLHICSGGGEKDVSVRSCGLTDESAIITSSHNLLYFHVIILNYYKNECCREMLHRDTAAGWLQLVLSEITSGKGRVLRACRQADLIEKLKA